LADEFPSAVDSLGRLVGFALKIDGLKIGLFCFQHVADHVLGDFVSQKTLYHHFVPLLMPILG
jgi:hypothetical protein